MPNTSRDIIGINSYYNTQYPGSGHLNMHGYSGQTYYYQNPSTGAGTAVVWPSTNISLNAFYGTSPVNEWAGGIGGK